MFKKISTSFNLVKVSFRYIKRDWELLVYTILSLLSSLAILITFIWVDFFYLGFFESLSSWTELQQWTYEVILFVMSFLYYLTFSFITFFYNTAIITSVQRRNNWEDNKLWDGLKDSMKHLKEIFIWSLINATVTSILNLLQRKFWENSIVWSIIVWLIGWMWNILTFFSFPLMVLNWLWPKDAIKESWSLFKKTWWERAIIHVWVWLLFTLIYLLLVILWVAIIYSWLIITGIIFIVLGLIFIIILSTTCDVIIKTILLHYVQTWAMPSWLEWETAIIDIAWEK